MSRDPAHMSRFNTRDDRYWIKQAYQTALMSIDPSTQNGAVIIDVNNTLIGRGYNRFATGLQITHERLTDRLQKYPRTLHAERAAIWDAIQRGFHRQLQNATMYIAWYACNECAIDILESGIARVVGHKQHPGVAHQHSKWAELVATGLDMLREGGVQCDYYDDNGRGLGCEPIKLDYKLLYP